MVEQQNLKNWLSWYGMTLWHYAFLDGDWLHTPHSSQKSQNVWECRACYLIEAKKPNAIIIYGIIIITAIIVSFTPCLHPVEKRRELSGERRGGVLLFSTLCFNNLIIINIKQICFHKICILSKLSYIHLLSYMRYRTCNLPLNYRTKT